MCVFVCVFHALGWGNTGWRGGGVLGGPEACHYDYITSTPAILCLDELQQLAVMI